ncbi:4-(cytidine 5'-diphospho)-2-C-methyl-D-erythritol kinase [Maribrevibacterium harenarium]|uniref:4-diphosphocytidyl-2-C-methyl-D-erythritol kinase n=1 Tax=Maribrevibacterium harenarium TaxID=2589817 RepID=A0A501X2R0_9GAMM|nr:4-(cytidine 5'-diphospho)-2-C-methyl-D-erythritol kinase [Maribrevibacterium harenarium]TPE54769.1 4-(cytidine 5'-diphospho)-2-C-methyl-D-erythritol kinase [Maribrevibacterium harenarium]
MTSITLPAPAKLNLFLHINGRRPDGYHNLQTIFQFIDIADTLHFSLHEGSGIHLENSIVGVAVEDNLIYKAANLLQPFAKSLGALHIRIDKQLPMGGGLGGGSSDAATTLLAANQLWQCGLSLDQLAEFGRQLGADVPVFVRGHAAFAEGIGELLTPVTPNTPYYLVLKPDCEVATGQIFTDKDLTRDTPPITIPHALKQGGHNDFLKVVLAHYPQVKEAFDWLSDFGLAKLTGTGACLFVAFDSLVEAEHVKSSVPNRWQAWVCRGRNESAAHLALNRWLEQHALTPN